MIAKSKILVGIAVQRLDTLKIAVVCAQLDGAAAVRKGICCLGRNFQGPPVPLSEQELMAGTRSVRTTKVSKSTLTNK